MILRHHVGFACLFFEREECGGEMEKAKARKRRGEEENGLAETALPVEPWPTEPCSESQNSTCLESHAHGSLNPLQMKWCAFLRY